MIRLPRRAIIFDLDDTLYRERQFAISGYMAVASHVSEAYGCSPGDSLRVLLSAYRHGRRQTAFQELCARFHLGSEVVPRLVDVLRAHTPRLRLSLATRQVLGRLRPSWRLGILTNGPPDVQRRKVEALGLARVMDAVVFASECEGGGKPNPRAFDTVLGLLDVDASNAVFVGDDGVNDIDGGRNAGLRTIHVVHRRGDVLARHPQADATIGRLVEIFDVLPTLTRHQKQPCRLGERG